MFTLPNLDYDYNALEPHIDARTMEVHHTKHHQAYIDKLNTALEKYPNLQEKSLEELMPMLSEIPEDVRTTVKNNGGGHYNHTLFWKVIGPDGSGSPEADLAASINNVFGTFAAFQEQFTTAAMNQFGSGWAWLTVENGELHVCSTPNQDNPLMKGNVPILGLDVWEHAYYLNYQNKRADYIKAWWNVVNWQQVSKNYQQALG